MPLNAFSLPFVTSSTTPPGVDWSEEVEKNLAAINRTGKKLVAERFSSRKGPGTDLVLMSFEAELIRCVSRIYILNLVHHGSRFPPLSQWLTYVNLAPSEMHALLERVHTIQELTALNDKQIVDMCESLRFHVENKRRLRKSSYNLKRYILRWQSDEIEPLRVFSDKELAWLSFDYSNPSRERSNISECGVETFDQQDSCTSDSATGSNASQSSLSTCTPPPSPGIILTTPSSVVKCLKPKSSPYVREAPRNGNKYEPRQSSMCDQLFYMLHSPEEPSVSKPQMHCFRSPKSSDCSRSEVYRLNRSLSQDSSRHKSSQCSLTSGTSNTRGYPNGKFGSALSPQLQFHVGSSRPAIDHSVTMPRSPGAARASHCIPHKWKRHTAFFVNEPCRVCNGPLRALGDYEKCSSCKTKVHRNCKSKLGDTCGLTVDVLKEAFSQMFVKDYEEDNWKQQSAAKQGFLTTGCRFPCDSPENSSSSPGSSTPSTPAYPLNQQGTSKVRTFAFTDEVRHQRKIPEPVAEFPDIVIETEQWYWGTSRIILIFIHAPLTLLVSHYIATENESSQRLLSSQGSDSTVRGDCGTSSEGTLLTESCDTTRASSGEISDDKGDLIRNHVLFRSRWSNGTIRIPNNWTDVTIAPGQVEIKERSLLGHGRFGDVHKGNYFGDVAVKMLNMDHIDEPNRVEAFKQEVASYKNTRHVNIVLFMGCCLDKNSLFIVTNLCKGPTLHVLLHERHQKFDFGQVVHFGIQICQGVSYLHTKGILHKDLRTKNIFIERNNRVVITDFGLFTMKRLREPDHNKYLRVPEKWLTYLAPELIRSITDDLRELPFSERSDMYSFGTIWYELMTYQFPFSNLSNDIIIYRVGKGCTGGLMNVKSAREVKEILMHCWAFLPSSRPSFLELQTMIERLPKRRLTRSPSYPVSRSHDSMFA